MQLSFAHLKSMLWASPEAQAYAVVNGAAVPGLRERLRQPGVKAWECLTRGALSPEKGEKAPYVVELTAEDAFSDWLLGEAGATYPNWGVVGVGPVTMMAMREHGRRLIEVTLPEGEGRRWSWFDPLLWGPLLPRLDSGQLHQAFGALTDWVVVTPKSWQWLTLSAGQVVVTPRDCLAVGAGL